jgi:2-polyprenyl-6-hydroxyphenyl methylase/3-demethylubiquinone-9 3-methyltransferase
MASARTTAAASPTVDPAEVARFGALAAQWWDPAGRMGMLHKFNPVRLKYIKEAACLRFERDPKRLDSLAGLRILDIGCGAGLLSEPLARLGGQVVGADPAVPNIEAAKLHAEGSGLALDYRATTAEALADAGERFDLVLAMEVVEHVADVALFVQRCAEMVKPGGLLIGATINRTLKSFALAIVGAEYVLRWLPRGTHRWDKFVTPDEAEALLLRRGLRQIAATGVVYDLLADRWRLSPDMDVNYMLAGARPKSIDA